MKYSKLLVLAPYLLVLASTPLAFLSQSDKFTTNVTRFVCGTLDGIPTTVISIRRDVPTPLIRWLGGDFEQYTPQEKQYTPQERCKQVTDRFVKNTEDIFRYGFVICAMTTNTLAFGLLKHTITEIHDRDTGLIDAVLFANILGLSHEEMAKIVNRTVPGLRKNPTSDKLQPSLLKLYILTVRLRDLLEDSMENVRIYLRAPNPKLNDKTPLSYLLERKFEDIEILINSLEKEQIDQVKIGA